MRITIDNVTVDIYNDDVIIWKSYLVKNIKIFVQKLIDYKSCSKVLKQDYRLLCSEFFIHNLCYKLGIFRKQTETTNLSLYEDMNIVEKIIYKCISIFF